MNAVQSQQIPAHLQIAQNQQEIITKKPEDSRLRVVAFVGDLLTLRQKQSDAYRLGGKLFPEVKTLPGNIVTACALTPLRQAMLAVHKNMVDPREHKNYIQSYEQTGVYNPKTGQFETIIVGVDGASKDLLFKPIHPVQELGYIAYRGDGVVEVPGFETINDIREAQLFYFPNWGEILRGNDFLPRILRQLEDHLRERLAVAQTEEMKAVGRAYLLSCEQFRLFGTEYIKFQTMQIKDAEKTPGAYQGYDEIAERLFGYLEITRQDSLIQDAARQQNVATQNSQDVLQAVGDLAKVVAGLVALQAQGGNASVPPVLSQPQPATQNPNTLEFSESAITEIVEPGETETAEVVENKTAAGLGITEAEAQTETISNPTPKTNKNKK